jgi:hypothetical protein
MRKAGQRLTSAQGRVKSRTGLSNNSTGKHQVSPRLPAATAGVATGMRAAYGPLASFLGTNVAHGVGREDFDEKVWYPGRFAPRVFDAALLERCMLRDLQARPPGPRPVPTEYVPPPHTPEPSREAIVIRNER